MNNIYHKKLKGEALFDYSTIDHPDKEYASLISMLPYACMDLEKAFALLERSVQENRQLVAIYPGEEKTDTSQKEFIGSIMDGALYIQ